MILLLVACTPPTWTDTSALAAHRSRLDANADGRVVAAEYDAHRWNGPPFATADRDADGDLSAAELAWLVRAQSPTTFDAPLPQAPLALGDVASGRPSAAQLDLNELLVWMNDSVRAAGGTPLAPEAIAAAVATGRVDSEAARAAFHQLGPAWIAQGWAWPVGLPPPS